MEFFGVPLDSHDLSWDSSAWCLSVFVAGGLLAWIFLEYVRRVDFVCFGFFGSLAFLLELSTKNVSSHLQEMYTLEFFYGLNPKVMGWWMVDRWCSGFQLVVIFRFQNVSFSVKRTVQPPKLNPRNLEIPNLETTIFRGANNLLLVWGSVNFQVVFFLVFGWQVFKPPKCRNHQPRVDQVHEVHRYHLRGMVPLPISCPRCLWRSVWWGGTKR